MVSLNIQEREENRALNRGMSRSMWGLLLCWVPLVGLLLSITGFIKVAVRVTQQHKIRYVTFFILSLIIVAFNIGAITGGIWVFTQRPEWVQDAKTKVLSALQLNDYLNPAPVDFEGIYKEGNYVDQENPDGIGMKDQFQYDENGISKDGEKMEEPPTVDEGEIKGGNSMDQSKPASNPDANVAVPVG